MPSPGNARKTLATLGAFCLFLSSIEYTIPKPLPFLRLGLANVPLILALPLPASLFCPLLSVKVLAQALISGTLFSYVFLFSLVGTAASGGLMFLLARLARSPSPARAPVSFVGISVAGAFLSNVTQIALARCFILGKSALYIAPPFLLSGIASGFLLGLFCEKFTRESAWYKNLQMRGLIAGGPPAVPSPYTAFTKETALFIAGIALSAALVFTPQTAFRVVLFAVFWLFAILRGRGGKPLITFLVFAVIVLCNLLSPYGRVLFEAGPLTITQGALLSGIKKAATIEGLIMISKTTVSANLKLPGAIGGIIGESFRIMHALSRHKTKIDVKDITGSIDRILMQADAL
jgi:heptaprenyl diphosphate synthase